MLQHFYFPFDSLISMEKNHQHVCNIYNHVYVTVEPHLPHVLIENGDMSLGEYDEYLHGRSEFIKATKKDSSNERKVSGTVHLT